MIIAKWCAPISYCYSREALREGFFRAQPDATADPRSQPERRAVAEWSTFLLYVLLNYQAFLQRWQHGFKRIGRSSFIGQMFLSD